VLFQPQIGHGSLSASASSMLTMDAASRTLVAPRVFRTNLI
jgi:hypothetical protein